MYGPRPMLGTITIPDRRWRDYAAGVLLGVAIGVAIGSSAWLLRGDDQPEHQHRRDTEETAHA